MQRRTLLALIALLGVATPLVSADPDFKPAKVPVFIAPGEVTINGETRPDLGRSFSDTIAGGLLGTGSFTIIDPVIAAVERAPAGDPSTPEDIAADSARGAHYAFIPRLIVEDNYHRLTLKKVRVSDGEVIDIYEKSAKDLDRSAMFQLLDETMKLVYTDIARDRSRKARVERDVIADYDPDPDLEMEPSGTVVVVPPAPKITVHYPTEDPEPKPKPRITEPKPARNTGNSVAASAPRTKKRASAPVPKPKKETKPIDAEEGTEVAEYAGRLRAVNTDWDFCIIEVAKRGSLKVDDELLVRGSTSLKPLGKLRISKVEGTQVVADAIDVPLEDLRAGFKVYRWAKP